MTEVTTNIETTYNRRHLEGLIFAPDKNIWLKDFFKLNCNKMVIFYTEF